jgi:hypothetical protein
LQQVIEFLPGAIATPGAKVRVDALPLRQVMRQVSPLATVVD